MKHIVYILAVLLLAACSKPALNGQRAAWIDQLKNAETGQARLEAARALGETIRRSAADSRAPDAPTVAALDAALRDHDSGVRLEAALALAWIGHEAGMTVPVLEEAMRHHGILALRRAAEQALIFADRAGESALDALRNRVLAMYPDAPAMEVTGSGGRTQAQAEKRVAELMAQLSGFEKSKPSLEKVNGLASITITSTSTSTSTKMTTGTAAEVLMELERVGPDAAPAVPVIAALLKHEDPRLRARAVEALGGLGTTAFNALRAVSDACYDADSRVRAAAARAVLRLDPNTGSSVFFQYTLLGDSDPMVRRAAAAALADFGPIAKETVAEPVTPERIKAIFWPRTLAMRMIGPAVPRLQAALKDSDPGVRAEAARTLAQISPDAAKVIPSLLAASADAEPRVRVAAAWALGELPAASPEASARLKAMLSDKDAAARAEALVALVRIARDDGPLLPLLENAARDPAPEVRRALLLALDEVGAGNLLASKPLTETLLALVRHADPAMRAAAAQTVGQTDLRTDEAVQELSGALDDKSPEVVAAAAQALGWMGPAAAGAAPALERLAAQGGQVAQASSLLDATKVRYTATLALAWIDRQSTATLQRLMAAMREPGVASGMWQVASLNENSLTTRHLPLATSSLATRHSPLATDSLLALGWRGAGAKDAAPLLAGILRERRNPVQVQLLAGMALEAILDGEADEAGLEPIFKTVQTQTAERQLQAVTALIWLGAKAAPAQPELMQLVKNRNCAGELRVAATAAIGAMGAVAAGQAPALATLLGGEKDPQVKAALAAVLGGMGLAAKAATAPLTAALGDGDAGVRQAAALALGRIGGADPGASAALARGLGDSDQRVRLAAATALGGLGAGARAAQPKLQALAAADPDLLVRQAAAAALKKI